MIRENGDRLEVSCAMTIPHAARLLEAGTPFAASRDALFDLGQVEQADSSAIAVILGWMRAAQTAGRSLRVANAPQSLRSIADLYGVLDILPLT